MTTYATITVGYTSFLLPASDAQKCFEVLSGRGIDIDFVGTEDATAAGTSRGRALRQTENRVLCELISSDDMHDALDRAKLLDMHKEAQRAAYLSDVQDAAE